MNKYLTGAVLLIAIVGVGSYLMYRSASIVRGSGNIITEARDVAGFNRIELSGRGNLLIDQSGDESLNIEAEDNIIDRIETVVEGNTLKIRFKREWSIRQLWPTKDINYHLTVADIEHIGISGSGYIETENISTDELTIGINGSGKGSLGVSVKKLDLNVSGSGRFVFKGTAEEQKVNINGSGNYDAKDLASKKAEFRTSGSGKGIINASDELSVNISGSGNVRYIGSPVISQKISGSGSISQYKE